MLSPSTSPNAGNVSVGKLWITDWGGSIFSGQKVSLNPHRSKSGKTNLCSKIRATQGKGVMPDGTSRFKVLLNVCSWQFGSYFTRFRIKAPYLYMQCKGKDLFHFMGTSTFSEYTVLPEISLAKVPKDVPLNKVCLLGCGISTGYGAVFNTCQVEKDAICAVWGLGCVGLAVVMGKW